MRGTSAWGTLPGQPEAALAARRKTERYQHMQKVFVLDHEKQPLMPCRPARARYLLTQQKAAVFRTYPFTIILKDTRPVAVVEPLRLKIDPGSKTTGIALVNAQKGERVFLPIP